MVRKLLLAPALALAVPTPWGERPSSCVVTVPEGASVVTLDEGVGLRHSNGHIENVPVAEECRQDKISEKVAAKASTDGWLDNQAWTHVQGYSKFTGSFNVPANPPSPSKPETLYYFFGMQNNIDPPVNILQPVLTWGDETEGASGGWSIWSWACCPSDITFVSKNIGGLKEGMLVEGAIEKLDAKTWRIDTAFADENGQRQNTTLLADLGHYRYDWADVTLEVYNISSCGEHSPGEVRFQNLELTDENGQKLTPRWSGNTQSSCGGQVTVHDATSISIQHSNTEEVAV